MFGTGLFTSSLAVFDHSGPLGSVLPTILTMVAGLLGTLVLVSFVITRILKRFIH